MTLENRRVLRMNARVGPVMEPNHMPPHVRRQRLKGARHQNVLVAERDLGAVLEIRGGERRSVDDDLAAADLRRSGVIEVLRALRLKRSWAAHVDAFAGAGASDNGDLRGPFSRKDLAAEQERHR